MKQKSIKIPSINIKKYGGKQIATLNDKIIASAENLEDLINKIKKTKKDKPLSEFQIFSVPKTLSIIYYAVIIEV